MMASRRDVLKAAGALSVYFTLPGCDGQADAEMAGRAAFGSHIEIDAAGIVTLNMGKVELGQGIGTALAQIAAEELAVDFSRMRLAGVDTDFSPDESYTYSSISIQQSGPRVRQAAAAGRQFLLQRAAQSLSASETDLSVVDGDIRIDGATTEMDYWQLLQGEDFDVSAGDENSLMPVADYKIVGQAVHRLDIPGKVFGDASFLQDLRFPDMVHARVVRPPAERAQIKDFSPDEAAALPGVLKIVRDGNFVAVIAEREGQARTAAAVLRGSTEWSLARDLPGGDSVYEWLKAAPIRIEPIVSRESTTDYEIDSRTIKAVYQRPYQAHASISPSAAVALFENDKLTVWSHAQGMYPLRTAIAHTLGLQPEQVRCIHQEASGCYGHNGGDDAACDAAVLALQFPGRPVRLQWERADEFTWEPYGPAMHIETSAELDESGQVRSWDFDLWSCPHASRPRSAGEAGHLIYAQHKNYPMPVPAPRSIPQPSGGADRNAIPLYSFENVTVNKHLVMEVPVRASSLRGLGAYGNVFAIESFMDELALAAGQDPLAFRQRHLDDPRALALLDRLRDVSNWDDRPAQESGEGWGIGFARFKNLSSYVGVVFELSVDSGSGKIALRRATAVCDAGLVVNPDGVRAQIEGGIVQSASWTLKEQVRMSDSQKESTDWASYPILRFDEVPEVNVVLMSQDDQPALGVGETAQGPTAAAIANAVFHASGQRLRRLPFSPERFLESKT